MLSQGVLDPILCSTPSSSLNNNNNKPFSSSSLFCCNSIINYRNRRRSFSMASNHRTNNFLRHMESMKILPSGAGCIPHLNAVILGESLATEENDFVLPSEEFASQANVQSPEQVFFFFF
jgi:acetyl-CoA synthetase